MIKIRSAALIEAYSKIRPFEGVLKFLFFELKIKISEEDWCSTFFWETLYKVVFIDHQRK